MLLKRGGLLEFKLCLAQVHVASLLSSRDVSILDHVFISQIQLGPSMSVLHPFGFLQVLVQFFQVVKCLSDNEIDVQISIFSVIEVQSYVSYSHHNIWRDAQIPGRTYHYYHPGSKSLDFAALIDDIKV